MEIFIETMTGRKFTLEVEPLDIVGNLMAKIQDKGYTFRTPLDQQRIVFADKQWLKLEDSRTLSSYKITNKSKLLMVPRLPTRRIRVVDLQNKLHTMELDLNTTMAAVIARITNNTEQGKIRLRSGRVNLENNRTVNDLYNDILLFMVRTDVSPFVTPIPKNLTREQYMEARQARLPKLLNDKIAAEARLLAAQIELNVAERAVQDIDDAIHESKLESVPRIESVPRRRKRDKNTLLKKSLRNQRKDNLQSKIQDIMVVDLCAKLQKCKFVSNHSIASNLNYVTDNLDLVNVWYGRKLLDKTKTLSSYNIDANNPLHLKYIDENAANESMNACTNSSKSNTSGASDELMPDQNLCNLYEEENK